MHTSVITGTGSYIPTVKEPNASFLDHVFYDKEKQLISKPPADVVAKLEHATGISERRYAPPELNASGMGLLAARAAIADGGIDPESIDQIIVAHNFGDINTDSVQSGMVPSIASRIKHGLDIHSPACVAYDLLFGCPGWIQSMIHTHAFFKAGVAKRILLVATETLSRVIDPADMDSMIFADGSGACVMEWKDTGDTGQGILSTSAQTHAVQEAWYIDTGLSNDPADKSNTYFIKMNGRKVYEYALRQVPAAMKDCLDKARIDIRQLKKVFIHQANEKMDDAIIKRFYELYDVPAPEHIMPMSIHWLGNSSVATIPTLFDLVRNNQVDPHSLSAGDVILFASVGAGMNINAVCYRY